MITARNNLCDVDDLPEFRVQGAAVVGSWSLPAILKLRGSSSI